MKLNRKIIIPAITLLVGSALAGSVSSTIAWYQYSTRTTAAYIGTSAGTSGNLKMRIRDYAGHSGFANDWETTNIAFGNVETYLASTDFGSSIEPITTGALAANAAIPTDTNDDKVFYSNPVVGFGPIEQWNKAEKDNYVFLPLELRFISKDGTNTNDLAKDVYLTDLLIQNDYANTKSDLSSAIRVHISAYQKGDEANAKNFLISKNGGSTLVVSKLDLDEDNELDKDYSEDTTGAMYGFGEHPENQGTEILYGANGTANVNQVAYNPAGVIPTGAKANASFAADAAKVLGSTTDDEDTPLYVDVTIWVEGWQQLGTTPSAVWSVNNYVGALFDVGMQFGVRAAD